MFALALKSKAIALVLTAAVASGGTIAGIMMSRSSPVVASAGGVPLPSAPPSGTPGTVSPDNARAFAPAAPLPPAPANVPVYAPANVPAATPAPMVTQVQLGLSAPQLDELLGPIALYPDPLIAEMLPASTYPDQLAAAALYLRYNPAPSDLALQTQPWEPSIRSLAHSPSVLVWMYNNPDWTRTLGTAFTYQPQDVMNSIQRLRFLAMSAGSLIDSPQQIVLVQERIIYIEPAVDVLYVPVYDWRVCYTRRYEPTFFVSAHIGGWLDNDCDWDDHFITIGARWDLGWDHRWDHDSGARPVTVRTARDTTVNNTTVNRTTVNNTTVNNTTVNNTAVVKVGGTQWKRNEAQPAPTLPAKVKPAGGGTAAPAATPTPRVAPTPTQVPSVQPGRDRGPTAPPPDVRDNPPVRGADRSNAPTRGPDNPPARGPDRGNPPARGNDRGNPPASRGADDNPGRGRGN